MRGSLDRRLHQSERRAWTDVKVRESDIGTLFGGFGLNLSSVTAQARVEVKQIIGVREGGLPFVAETGDQIECVWAQFVRARDGSTSGFTVTPSNPILLTGGPNTWTGSVANLQFTNQHDDVAIRYWAGARDGTAPCNFSTASKGPLPHAFDDYTKPQQIDWFNVYDTGAAPGTNAPPKLRLFALGANTCGGPGFLYTTSTNVAEECRVNFTAIVDTGVNNVRGEITVQPHGTGVDPPAPVTYDTTGGGSNLATVTGWITIHPNEVTGDPDISQDYTQVGPTYFSVDWHQTSGQMGTSPPRNCPAHASCSGTFEGETVSGVADDIQQATYMNDPLSSSPLVATSVSTPTTSFPALGSTGPFTVSFTHTALDKEHIVLLRDSVQGSGNRTKAIYCGNPPGKGASALGNAIRDGCAKGLVENTRGDSCSPAPGSAADPWDCVQIEQGNKSSIAKGAEDRFACTTNNWVTGGDPPPEGDQRWAYIILTEYGRTFSAANNDWLPIAGLLRVYVTGWDQQGGGGGPASCADNDDPPRGYDGNGAQLWGHIVSPITLDPAVIVGDAKCDMSLENIQCSPGLVR